jgi:hypothetical protein
LGGESAGVKDLRGGVAVAEPPEETTNPSTYLRDLLVGGIVTDSDTAISIAQIILKKLYGIEESERQQPLTAEEQSGSWVVTGSYNRGRKVEGPGYFSIIIQKKDCKIIDVRLDYVMNIPPDIQRLINKAQKNEQLS